MTEESKLKLNYETSVTGTKGNLELPAQPINVLATVTARCIDSIRSGSEKVGNMLCNSASVIGKPIGAWFYGKTEEIQANSQLIVANIMYKKEINAIKHLQFVAEEFNRKVDNNEEIPDKIEESDNLLLIQDNASTTSNEEFLKLWAKLYTEEACNPGSISRKTIKLVETLDINIVKTLENDILPYCDSNGFYWGQTEEVTSIILVQDYGLIDNKNIVKFRKNIKEANCVVLNQSNMLYIHPGYGYTPKNQYILTKSGLEIKNILNIFPKQKHIKTMIEEIEKSAKLWTISSSSAIKLKTNISAEVPKYIICNKKQKIKYPKNIKYKTFNDFYKTSIANLGEIDNAK